MVSLLPKDLSPHFGSLLYLLLFLQCQAMVLYGEDIELATRFARIAESLIKGHPQEHTLLAKLTHIIACTTLLVEPFQAVMDRFLKGFNSSLIVGDFDHAAMMSVVYCTVCIFVVPNLENTPRILAYFVSQNVSANVYLHITCMTCRIVISASHILLNTIIKVKHRRKTGLYSLMCFSNICTAFRGCAIETIEGIKDNSDLLLVAEETKNSFLLHHILIGQMYLDCYFRNYSAVVDFGEKYRITRRNKGERRALDIFYSFFEGLCK